MTSHGTEDSKQDQIIMHDSPEAAQYRTGLSGWVSRNGLFFGDSKHSEDLARYEGCTHHPCLDCGKPARKNWLKCDACILQSNIERYNAMPKKDWDGESMLYSQAKDEFYCDYEDAIDNLEGDECIDDLRLMICEPIYPRRLEIDYFMDDFPEDGEVPQELEQAIGEFNEKIKGILLSWAPGTFRLKTDNAMLRQLLPRGNEPDFDHERDPMPTCPICKREMSAKEAYDAITRFLVENGCTVNLCNPGGREFHFPKIGRVQISDYCRWCDLEILEKAKADAEA